MTSVTFAGPAAARPHGRPRPATISRVLRAAVGASAPRHPRTLPSLWCNEDDYVVGEDKSLCYHNKEV